MEPSQEQTPAQEQTSPLDMTPSEAFENYKRWHRENLSKGQTTLVKQFLKEDEENRKKYPDPKRILPIPILHNEGEIILQYCGWSISLLDDGTWYWEDTTGG